ncbi:Pectinesterase inhibitor [Corchorus olitorius]|uniref:Pectinesterase inhibitor n=1 Tax=Corchorus olitorius TaxID=93759 RepID=A0A1R3KBX4_9ROSI|nr:Pectinesterase inhibitor [Corchorus olitorius]
MASQSVNLFPAMAVLILTLIPLHGFAQETGKTLIENTCKQTEFPEECISALESDPGSLSANLTGLTKIIIQQSASKLGQTITLVDTLVKNATEYLTWGFLMFCRDSYNISFNQIQNGLQAFDQLKYDESYKSVAGLNKAVVDCNNQQGLEILNQVNTALFRISKDAMQILDSLF